jgi:GTPase Era involved in 16S rRNA processing
MMTAQPQFAVVGHPNKGKSSIVSTLSQDDSVQIGRQPGTTTRCRSYSLSVDGEVLYTLIDTPGFQRARAAWAWMRSHESSADRRREVVQSFVETHAGGTDFPEEVELLAPILAGAGILYVVDGSVPYGAEYESEMEILRWTGQPRLALINPIGDADHVEAWRNALGQYFSVVRVFDAVTADFSKRVELLRAFGQLEEDWRQPLDRAVNSLIADRSRRHQAAARTIAEAIAEMLTLEVEKTIGVHEDPGPVKDELIDEYQRSLVRIEKRARQSVERAYEHHALERTEPALEALEAQDLFSVDSWRIFGLTRTQLAGIGALGGAVAGGAFDVALGGASVLLGALIGGGVGAVGTLVAANRLVEVKVLEISLGRRKLVAGPTSNRNFPHVVLGRARLHHALVAGRAHASRGELAIDEQAARLLTEVSGSERRALEREFARVRRGRELAMGTRRLGELLVPLLERDAD